MNTRSSTSPASGSDRRLSASILLTVLVLCLSVPGPVRAQDSWIGPDKILHLFGAFMVTSVSYVVAYNVTDWDHWKSLEFGVGMGVAASVGKELYDSLTGRGEASGWDLVWDGLGIGLGVVFIDALVDPPRPGPRTGQSGDPQRYIPLARLALIPGRQRFRMPGFPVLKPVDSLPGVPTFGLPSGGILRIDKRPEGD